MGGVDAEVVIGGDELEVSVGIAGVLDTSMRRDEP